jgi:hypothetical protein
MGRVTLSTFDAKSFAQRLYERVRKPDGTGYPVFGPEQFPAFIGDVRKSTDVLNEHDVTIKDHKRDIDEHSARLGDLEERMAAVEARPAVPFPVA